MSRAALLRHAVLDAALAGLIAAVLFVPIMGLVLHDQGLELHPWRGVVAAGLVFGGRLAMVLALRGCARRPWLRLWEHAAAPLRDLAAHATRHPLPSLGLALALLLAVPLLGATNYLLHVLAVTFVYVLLATGLNIVVGLAGLLDLGYVAFYAVGAYTYALLALHLGLSFWLAVPCAALVAACAGFLLGFPVLKMEGDYLAIVTLGFGEIIRLLLTNLVGITGGPNGLQVPRPGFLGLVFNAAPGPGERAFHQVLGLPFSPAYRYMFMYWLTLAFAVAGLGVFYRLRAMPMGRAWEALRENAVASQSLGINPHITKLSAFTLGAAFGGVGGVLYAGMEGFITPMSFTFIESALILAMVVLGGMGSMLGVVLAAAAITLLPEAFREFGNYRMLVFGLAMVGIMIWRPAGLIKARRRTLAGQPDAA